MKKEEVEHGRIRAEKSLAEAGITLGSGQEIEITDFGKGDFAKLGLALVIRVAEFEYASKWLVIFPGQTCPNHYHEKIKETFFIIKGSVAMKLNNRTIEMKAGDQVTLEPGTWHTFTSENGAIIEEVTNRQYPDDSIFEDGDIQRYITVEDQS